MSSNRETKRGRGKHSMSGSANSSDSFYTLLTSRPVRKGRGLFSECPIWRSCLVALLFAKATITAGSRLRGMDCYKWIESHARINKHKEIFSIYNVWIDAEIKRQIKFINIYLFTRRGLSNHVIVIGFWHNLFSAAQLLIRL